MHYLYCLLAIDVQEMQHLAFCGADLTLHMLQLQSIPMTILCFEMFLFPHYPFPFSVSIFL